MDETEKQFDARMADARRAHATRMEGLKIHNAQIQSFSTDAMKAPALVAAGGIAAALGFYSANYTRLAANPENLATFNAILYWLFLSLLLTVAAPGFAYFSQLAYAECITSERNDWTHPYVHSTPRSSRFQLIGDICRWTTVTIVTAAIGCLIRGGYLFLRIVV